MFQVLNCKRRRVTRSFIRLICQTDKHKEKFHSWIYKRVVLTPSPGKQNYHSDPSRACGSVIYRKKITNVDTHIATEFE